MRPDDGGSVRPALPEQAGHSERTLHEIYDFQTGIVDLTASDWATSAESVRGLSAEVRGIVTALRGAPDAWSGPAADAAYQTLGKLADNLDVHAEDIDRIEAGLTSAYDSVATARTAYVTRVRSISLDVDEGDYQRTPFRQPAQASPDLPTRARPAGLRPGRRGREGRSRAGCGPGARVLHRLDDHRHEEAARRPGRAEPGPRRLDRRHGRRGRRAAGAARRRPAPPT